MNELTLVNDVEKRLQKPQDVKVFPLTPTHRKELRTLRNDNIGQLQNQLRNIRKLKKEEYIKKYCKEIEKEVVMYQKVSGELNKDWEDRMKQIKNIIVERKALEEKQKDSISKMIQNINYGSISQLTFNEDSSKRRFDFNITHLSQNIATQEFDKKYGDAFKKSQEHIDRLHTMYEEAINFGDLEIVKEIYYKLKKSDKFFEKISDLKI